jgi:hypothetical protein
MELGDYLNSINQTKENVMRGSDDPKAVSGYPAFVVRRSFSYFNDTVLFANELNKYPNLDNDMQYEFFLHALPRKRRFAKWVKPNIVEDLQLIKAVYNYGDDKAATVLSLFTPDDLAELRAYMDEGGSGNSKPKKGKVKNAG